VLLRLRADPDLVAQGPVVESKPTSKEIINSKKKIKLMAAAAAASNSKRLLKEIHGITDLYVKISFGLYLFGNFLFALGYLNKSDKFGQNAPLGSSWTGFQLASCFVGAVLYALREIVISKVNIDVLSPSDRTSLIKLFQDHKLIAEDKTSLKVAEKSLSAIYSQYYVALKSRPSALTFFLRAHELKPKSKKTCSLISLFRCGKKQKVISLSMPLQNKIAEFLGCEDLLEVAAKLKK
jgi:hypothetical protein